MNDINLSDNFTLVELIKTDTGLYNSPSKDEIDSLRLLCVNVLQPLRDLYGGPITINSGYRSKGVNKAIGGVYNSHHMLGTCADITTGSKKDNEELFDIIHGNFKYRQLINEDDFSWIHIEYNIGDNKGQVLSL
jgi:hypothetical protein